MAVDPKQAEVTSDSPDPETPAEPGSDTAKRRKFASSLLKAQPTPVSADTSLDRFIAKANEELIDVVSAPFKPEHREGLLRRELEAVQAKLAVIEARAAEAEARAAEAEARATDPRSSPRWGLTIAAFLLGGAAMFAVSFVLPAKDRPAAPVATSPAVTPIATSPTVTPIATSPTVTPIPPAPAAPATEDVAAHEPAVPPPTPDKITKKPAGKPTGRRPAVREDPAPTPKPPEDDLYNPF